MATAATRSTTADNTGRLAGIAKRVLQPVFNAAWDFHIEGLSNVPASGPAILTPNHTSVLDSFVVPAVLERRIFYIGKAEYLDDWKTRKLFPALGMVPIDRAGGEAAQAALNTAARILEAGDLFGIYPEGTRARNGNLHRGHTGPARLALRTGAPLIPVGIIGTREVQPPDQSAPRPGGDITIKFGKPIDVSRHRHLDNDRRVLRQITDELMFEIRTLTGQQYDDIYASKANAMIASGETDNASGETDRLAAAEVPAESSGRERTKITTVPSSSEIEPVLTPVGGAPVDASTAEAPTASEAESRHRHGVRRGPRLPVASEGRPLEPRRSSADVLQHRPIDLVPVG